MRHGRFAAGAESAAAPADIDFTSPAQHDEVTTGVKPESSGIVSGFIAASKQGFPKVDAGFGIKSLLKLRVIDEPAKRSDYDP